MGLSVDFYFKTNVFERNEYGENGWLLIDTCRKSRYPFSPFLLWHIYVRGPHPPQQKIHLRPANVTTFFIFSPFKALPEVKVMPRIQSRRPGEKTSMFCHVIGEPFPEVSMAQDLHLTFIWRRWRYTTYTGNYIVSHRLFGWRTKNVWSWTWCTNTEW